MIYVKAKYSDLIREMERRGMVKKYWTTQDGRDIEIEKLDDNHLRNIVAMIERNNYELDMESEIGVSTFDPEWYKN